MLEHVGCELLVLVCLKFRVPLGFDIPLSTRILLLESLNEQAGLLLSLLFCIRY